MRFASAVTVMAVVLAGYAAPARTGHLGDCFAGSDPDVVIRACSTMLERGGLGDQEKSRAFARRGAAHHRKKHYALAISDYNEAISLDPANADAYASRGDVRVDLATELTASALPSWALTESAMRASREGFADHSEALSISSGRR